jgi:hypothetical protein
MPEPEQPIDVQRVLMDRARRSAERDQLPHARPLLPRLVGLALAVLVVIVVLFAFDRFLASMQRFLALPVVDPEPAVEEAIPAYVVPAEPEAPGPGIQPATPDPQPADPAGPRGN